MSTYTWVASAKVSRKGWVVIPAPLRTWYKIRQADTVSVIVEGDTHSRITLKFEDPIEAAYGMLAGGPDYTQLVVEEHTREQEREQAKVRA